MAAKKPAAKKAKTAAKPTVGNVVDDVLKRRAQALKAQAQPVPAMRSQVEARSMMAAPKQTAHVALVQAAAAAAATKEWLVAEGDSWFDYPGTDVLSALQPTYNVESVARAGDRVEMMAFGRGQLDKFAAAVENVIANGHTPKAILLSGGGNDIAGDEFGMLLNHARSPQQGLNDTIVRGVIDERVRDSYVWIIRTITALCQKMLQKKVRIIVHGYGYPVPDGRGYLGGWPFPGPWLRPGFIEKGFDDLPENTGMMHELIDRFNDMLKGVEAEFAHVRYVNLRDILPANKPLWDNELHPKAPGFKAAAIELGKAIEAP